MSKINVLDQSTINKIAAGEVVDRPSSIVKELMENSIDAQADAITVEIRDGGISLIRITDNGIGIEKEDLVNAFVRHATSKIETANDLEKISSLGFRGEALSSIAAVSMVEMISKTKDALTGCRYVIHGGIEEEKLEVGVPDGTTIIVKNLFYNTPARRKFLKSPGAESGSIGDIVEKIALSHPEVSVKFISNGQTKLFSSGNGKLSDVIYTIYGRETASSLLPLHVSSESVLIQGYVGKTFLSRSNRNQEIFFINGRYIKNQILTKAAEDAYKQYLMHNNFPFLVLNIMLDSSLFDVNVHPAKMEIRFKEPEKIYNILFNAVSESLSIREMIPEVSIGKKEKTEDSKVESSNLERTKYPEPFEVNRIEILREEKENIEVIPEQITLFEDGFLSNKLRNSYKVLGQLFQTYWIVEYNDQLYIIDQHAAHEKVLYERILKREKQHTVQSLYPPIIISLSIREEEMLKENLSSFLHLGFEIEHFGGREYQIRGVPDNIFSVNTEKLFIEILDTLDTVGVLEKVASMSCKAAVKGNNKMTEIEAEYLIEELLSLDNPYNCPHGRPTIISMSKNELEKKFKRIV